MPFWGVRQCQMCDMFLVHEPEGCNETQSASSLDCGLFVSVYAEHISRNAPLAFDQIDINYYLVAYEILNCKLM